MAGTADDGGEDGAGGVVAGETGLAHAGAIVHNQGGNLVVTHFELFTEMRRKFKLVMNEE